MDALIFMESQKANFYLPDQVHLEVQLLELNMKIFLHKGVLLQGVSTSLLDYLLYTKYWWKNSYERMAHNIFFCSKLLENVYCIVQCFQDMCTDFLFGDTMI